MKTIIFLINFLFASSLFMVDLQGQNDVKPLRVGARFLIPNVAGLHVEGILPILQNRVGIALDYSSIPFGGIAKPILDFDGDIDANINYLAVGANFYLKNTALARGPYLGVSYLKFSVDTEARSTLDLNTTATAEVSGVGFKLGTKTGKGAFFFGLELGAAIPVDGPKGTYVTEKDGFIQIEVFDEEIPVIPILNFTLGVALF